jgi:hypothetical protein
MITKKNISTTQSTQRRLRAVEVLRLLRLSSFNEVKFGVRG